MGTTITGIVSEHRVDSTKKWTEQDTRDKQARDKAQRKQKVAEKAMELMQAVNVNPASLGAINSRGRGRGSQGGRGHGSRGGRGLSVDHNLPLNIVAVEIPDPEPEMQWRCRFRYFRRHGNGFAHSR